MGKPGNKAAVLPVGVVTYIPCVEAFATKIKIESSDQGPFLGPIKGFDLVSQATPFAERGRVPLSAKGDQEWAAVI